MCPYCSGERVSTTYNLAEKYPEIAVEWDYVLNSGKSRKIFYRTATKKLGGNACIIPRTNGWQESPIGRRWDEAVPNVQRTLKMSYPARALFYYLRQACPSCTCEEPFRKYKMDIFLPERELVLEHDGYYYHSSLAARKRAERKDRALREAGYQVLRIV